MRSISPPSSAPQPVSGYRSSSERRRGTALVLTIIGHLLLVWLLLHLAPPAPPPQEPGRATTFTILPPGDTNAASTRTRRAPARAASATRRRSDPAPPARPRLVEAQPPVAPPPVPLIPGMLVLSKQDYASSDVGRIRSPKPGGAAGQRLAAADGAGDGTDSVAEAGPGAGPGGQRLYNAEWYVEPTDSQLAPFLPRAVPPGAWGEIACRTTPNYGVEDCRQLGDSQPGSGIARGLREAAWQFKVRPPRINGKPVIGAWVRIHFDFTKQR